MNPTQTCAVCPERARNCIGPCLCTVDSKDISEHIANGYCPRGKFNLGAGDWIAALFHRVGLAALVTLWLRLIDRPCKCSHRQLKMNARFHALYLWLCDWRDAFGE